MLNQFAPQLFWLRAWQQRTPSTVDQALPDNTWNTIDFAWRFCFLHTACCIHRALVLEILYSVKSWRIGFYAGYTANIICFWCWTDEELPFTVLNSIVTARVFISHLLTHFQHRRNPNTASWPWRQHSHACCARTCCHWKVGMLGISVWQELQAAMLPEER